MLSIYLVSFLENGSPFFCQERIGRNLNPFILIKFRSMAAGTQSVSTHLVDASSITRLGRFLRKTKLDELPQLFNVFLGNMSIVGPRPCLLNQTELIEERKKRGVYEILPGITGLAQVNEIDMSTPRKLARYDQLMKNKMNLKLYLGLILVTAFGKGRGDRVRKKNH
jgi:O-antigen biosynthesis protein WbqP